MALVCWSTLGGGFFTGRFRPNNLDTFTDGGDQRTVRSYCSDDNFRRLARAEQLAAEKGVTLAQIALAWILTGPMNVFALTAAWKPEEAELNAAAAEIDLTADERDWLDLER